MSGIEQNVRHVLTAAVGQLQANGVSPEALAEYVPTRRVMLIQRAATMRPLGEAWRLGALLLSARETSPSLWVAGV